MKLPHRFKIKNRVSYEVLFSDLVKNDPDCLGHTCDDPKQIIFKSGQSKTSLEKTVIHEVMHAINWENEIELTHGQIYKLEEALHKFLKLNKLL